MKNEYIRDNKESLGSLGQVGAEPDTDLMLFSVSPEQALVDGRDGEEAAHQDEGGREGRVMKAIGSYLKSKRQRK